MNTKSKLFSVLITIIFTAFTSGLAAAPRNMLPRFPELIIEKGLSENFKVTDCQAKVKISDNDADSTLKVSIINQGSTAVKSSVKFRILYPTAESQVRLRINGKQVSYSRANPRHEFELQPQETINIDLSARIQVNYSVDGVRKALREQESDKDNKKKGFVMSDFTTLFEREKFGKRFMVGSLVSKWGVFPVEFANVSIEVAVPNDYSMVASSTETWKESRSGNSKVFLTTAMENFSGAVFLPEGDREEFIQTQKILNSENFMH